jgi:hypothetical protein
MWIYRAGRASLPSALLPLMLLLLLLELRLQREAVAWERELGAVIVVNERLRDVVAVELVLFLIWVGQSRTYGTISWVCARARVRVPRVPGGAGLEELKSGRVWAKAVRSAFGNVLC